jgi:plastocyanin
MTKYNMRKIVIPGIFLLILAIGSSQILAATNAQEVNSILTLNPGATNSASQNPITPANITVPVGTNVTWINKDSSPHFIVSGTPEEGPDNIFYGDYFGTDENYTVTMENPGLYSYYDPTWSHIRGEITVEDVNVPTEPTSSENSLGVDSSDDNFVLDSDNSSLSTSEDGSFSSPSSSFQSSFRSFTSNDTSNQSLPLSSLISDQTLSNIIHKVGPLLGLLMNGGNSSLSSSSPLSSSFSQSNESFSIGDTDNQSSFQSSTTQSSGLDQTLSNIIHKVGPLLGLLMNGGNSSLSSPLSSLSQSNGMFEEGLTDHTNVNTTGLGNAKTLDGNSNTLLN